MADQTTRPNDSGSETNGERRPAKFDAAAWSKLSTKEKGDEIARLFRDNLNAAAQISTRTP